MTQASYSLLTREDWDARIARADTLASPCRLCPRACGVDRLAGARGFCGAAAACRISSAFAHHGEEPPLSGGNGSGTVFFSYCTLRCIFCQNYQLSHQGEGREYSPEALARELLRLQKQGCHNINLVTATHYLPWWLRGLAIASQQGLRRPLVYNCGGYEAPDVIALLDGIVDIYLPDMKYGDNAPARALSSADNYVQINQAAIRAMFRQAGPLRVDSNGVATRGMIIRHLVLPGGLSHSRRVVSFLTSVFDPADICISLMAQYRPLHRAVEHPPLNRRLLPREYADAQTLFTRAGFEGFFQQVEELDASFVIDFSTRTHEPLTGQ